MNEIQKPIHVVGISTVTSNDVAHIEISKLWDTFFKTPIKEQLGELASASVFSVYSDYENGFHGKYKITIGYAVNDPSNIPEGLTTVTIPSGNYAIYKSKSRLPEDIVATWKTIWAVDPKICRRNFIADFEEYQENNVTIHIGHK